MSLFITGTDTGVGKTRVAALLVRALRAAGTDAVGFKPICCGGREDAVALAEALNDVTFGGRDIRYRYRCTRAEPPLANAFTCSTVAIVVSPGNVVSSAPCAQPSFTASSSEAPVSRP